MPDNKPTSEDDVNDEALEERRTTTFAEHVPTYTEISITEEQLV